MNRNWEPYTLGVLAEDDWDPNYRSAVFVNNQDDLQCSIRILSTPPNSFPNSQRKVTCYGNVFEDHGFEDDTFADKFTRTAKLKTFLTNKLLVFQIERKSNPKGDYFNAKNIQLIPKKPTFNEDMSFFPIPVFSEVKTNGSSEEHPWDQFINNLATGSYVGRNNYISKELEDTPRFIFYSSADSEYFALGEFDSHHHAHGGFSFANNDESIMFSAVEREVIDETYQFEGVRFVELDEEKKVIEALARGKQIKSALKEKVDKNITTSIIHPGNSVVEKTVDKGEKEEVSIENAFMDQFITETKKLGLIYNLEDLYNFHTCIKSGSLTILAGMSGTGKSQLINAYQRGLHIDNDKFLMIPVSPTWTDDTDLIGYPDIMNNVYRPAESGLVNLLIEAEKNRSETFIVCFDEMNLAKVEHYFSQFLSVLEMEKGRRKLKLYNRDLQNKFYNGDIYHPDITIGENVIFTGTVNLDESTHQFSDKVLDRANLIKLEVEPFLKMLQNDEFVGEKTESKLKTSYAVHSFVLQERKMSLSQRELQFLWEVHLKMREVSESYGVGPRIVKQIDSYVKNIGNLPGCPIDRLKAFDIQFVQRVMPKLRGSEEMLLDLVGRFNRENFEVENSLLMDLFDEFQDISLFSKSRQLIKDKAKELMRSGYAF